jgi:DNA mismatch repair protein MutS2
VTEPLRDPCPDKTRSDLEYDRVLDALASRCASEMGKALAHTLPFAATRAQVRLCLDEAREATGLLAAAEPLPIVALGDVGAAVGRVGAAGVLAPPEIRDVGKSLEAARMLRRFLATRRSRLPALHAACTTDPTLDAVADELSAAFDPDGSLSSRASPRLSELRGEYHAARQRMLSRLEDFMTKYEGILQDRFVTEREGRYVVPVRSDAHERFPGIVHATSASGATLFVEPRAVIPMGNRLKVLEAEVQREEQAIYAKLSDRIRESLPSVIAAIDALARADVRAATARLAEDLHLVFPEITDEARLDLHEARHPLLLLDSAVSARPDRSTKGPHVDAALPVHFDAVVPSDLAISARSAMVVSGPNAGGKTVALKTMGLVALLVRAGLPVPCAAGSVVGIFDLVLTDVGDDQSLTKSLSTFSAHVRNLARILEHTGPGALVLLDELAGGTDPREGEALAAGMLDSLTARGGAVVVTTHYEGLKALALADPRFGNASMGFDLASMTPTFRLATGVPGSSSALAVARTFGLPSTVIERAEKFLSREDVHFETVVKKLNDERAALELARANADQREKEAEALRRSLTEELRQAKDREQRHVSKEAEALLGAVRRAREELREAQAKLRAKKLDPGAVKDAQTAIDRVAAQVAIGGPLDPTSIQTPPPPIVADAPPPKKGARVWVARLRAEADILDVLPDGAVRVQAGPLKLVVDPSELRPAAPESEPRRRAASPSASTGTRASGDPTGLEVAIQTTDNACDLRGLRTDDALSMAVSFLDRSVNDERRVCFLIHGHGTGALKEAIRRELKSSPYVRYFRAGNPGEGGDGVTIVWLS